MTFITGTVTNANPGPTLYALIETAALALGYTLDDTVTIGGNTHKVLKSAAAGNTYSLDWWLDINFPTTGTTGGIRFAPFEGYTAASDVGLRGPYVTSSTTIDGTTYSRFGATTSALETNWLNSASATGVSLAMTTTVFTYWISITRDRIIVLLSSASGQIAYTGFFTPTSAHSSWAGAALFPLIMVVLPGASTTAAASTSTAAVTRIPKGATINWSSSVHVGTADAAVYISGTVGGSVSEFTGQSTIIPIPVMFGLNATLNNAVATGYALVGSLDGLGFGAILSTASRGDSVTVGSDTWYAAAPSSNFGVFLKGI